MGIVLTALGWETVSEDIKKMGEMRIENGKKKGGKYVLVYPHTSTFDFILYVLYFLSLDDIHHKMKTPVNPRHMKQFGWLFESFGCILVTAKDVKNGGSTAEIVERLNKMDSFVLLISPKGSVKKEDKWRTGFYHIAKATGAQIAPGGFDYEKKKFVVKQPFPIDNMSYEEVESKTQEELYDICPLNIEMSEFPIKAHKYPAYPSVMSDERVIVLIGLVIIVVALIVFVFFRVRSYVKGK